VTGQGVRGPLSPAGAAPASQCTSMRDTGSVKSNRVSDFLIFLAGRLPPSLLTDSVKPGGDQSIAGSIARRLLVVLRTSDVTIPHGPAAGLRFNAGGSAPSFALGTTEPEVQAALVSLLRPGHVFYDVGANVGFYTVLASKRVGPKGRVYAFEPVPANVRAIHRNLELSHSDNATILPYAVTDSTGPLTLTLSEEPFWTRLSSLPPPPHPSGTIQVTGVSIDELVAARTIAPPDVIKLDVEGAEGHVLAGMRETMFAYRPVLVCELHNTWHEVRGLLEEAGYSMSYLRRRVRGKSQESRHIVALPRAKQ
jgi:FkbM family methyltransferase